MARANRRSHPGKIAGWQTGSDGIATGTQGSITFEIEDGSSFVSAPGQSDTGHRDHLYIFWDTPFDGLTTRDIQWRVLKDIPAEGASFATQAYRDGPSSAYQMLSMLRPQYDGPGSPCPFPFDTSLGDGSASAIPTD